MIKYTISVICLFLTFVLTSCAGVKNKPEESNYKPERQIRIITLASPFTPDHWMLTKERGLLRDYNAQDVLEIIEELKPNCLERFITGWQDPDALVPVREGYPQMTVLEFLNAAILAGAPDCEIVPKLNLQWLKDEKRAKYFWESAEKLYNLPLVRPIRNINLDVWDAYNKEIHTTQEERDAMFKRLRDIGYEQIGVNMTGLHKNHPEIDYIDFNLKKGVWEINTNAIATFKTFPNVKRMYMYIDYPGCMDAFRQLPVDEQARIYYDVIYPAQFEYGFTFVYAIFQDSWDANAARTSEDGPYKGKTIYEIYKELITSIK